MAKWSWGSRPVSFFALLASLPVLAACGGDSPGPAAPGDPQPPPLATGSLEVQATTTGEDLDEDGYLVRLGTEERRIGPNESTTFSAPASHAVTLSDVQVNCQADATEKSVTVEANAKASVAFSVACEAIDFEYDVGAGVPGHDLALIEEGHAIAPDYLERELRGDIPAAVRATITVKVVAHRRGESGARRRRRLLHRLRPGRGRRVHLSPFLRRPPRQLAEPARLRFLVE